jgi:hypothetical protein
MIKRISLNLELDLVAEARAILGTKGTTETVRRALEEVVRRKRVRGLVDEPFADLSDEALQALRGTRL